MAVVCTGTVIAASLAYSYNKEFRNFVHKNLPGFEPFLGTLDHFLGKSDKQPGDNKLTDVEGGTKSLPPAGDPLNLGLSVPKSSQKVR